MNILIHFNVTKLEYKSYNSMTIYTKLTQGRHITNILYDYIQLKLKLLLLYNFQLEIDIIQLIRKQLFNIEYERMLTEYYRQKIQNIGTTGVSG